MALTNKIILILLNVSKCKIYIDAPKSNLNVTQCQIDVPKNDLKVTRYWIHLNLSQFQFNFNGFYGDNCNQALLQRRIVIVETDSRPSLHLRKKGGLNNQTAPSNDF